VRPDTGSGHNHSFLHRVLTRIGGKDPVPIDSQVRRLEEKRVSLQRATNQWLSLLRDMEQKGESSHTTYERYYQAYLDAKRQQKQVELSLFNLRQAQAG
jgi:phage-related minor tail protein